MVYRGNGYSSQPRIDRLAFQSEDAEDALVHAAKRFVANESLEGFDAKGEFSQGERSLAAGAAIAEARKMLVGGVVRPIDDSQILAAAALHGRLDKALAAAHDKFQRLDDHAFAPACSQGFPPGNSVLFTVGRGYVNGLVVGGEKQLWILSAEPGQHFHVPDVVLV